MDQFKNLDKLITEVLAIEAEEAKEAGSFRVYGTGLSTSNYAT